MLDFVGYAQLVALFKVHILFSVTQDGFFSRYGLLTILRHGKVRPNRQENACDYQMDSFQTMPLDRSCRS